MSIRRTLGLIGTCLFLAVSFFALPRAVEPLPKALSNKEFWSMVSDFSEPGGTFWENLVSNEPHYAQMIGAMRRRGGVYLGVGPEQNFSYIAALRPDMAFIIDLRSENRNQHLMYKALFELSVDRAEFISRLFSLKPTRLRVTSSVRLLFFTYWGRPRIRSLYDQNLAAIRSHLISRHQFPLSQDDLKWIEYVLGEFSRDGFRINYSHQVDSLGNSQSPAFSELMTATDATGQPRSFLASEESFQFVKALQTRNLIVPIVGNFAGPRAIRAVGAYLREHNATVSMFYGSNVYGYLKPPEALAFCRNLASLPHDAESLYIGGESQPKAGFRLLTHEVRECADTP